MLEKLYETKYGVKLWMEDGSWLADRIMKASGPYQARNLKFLKYLVPHSKLTIDIGANVGMNSIEYSRFSDQVYAFEPHPNTYNMAEKNLKLNNITNTTLFNCGLGDVRAQLVMKTQLLNDGQNCIAKDQTISGPLVEVRTLDEYNLAPDLIKIDVEGYEMKVLAGAERTILKHLPVMQCEVDGGHMKRFGNVPQQLYDWFLDRNYKIQNYKGYPKGPNWIKEKGIADYFFIPPNHVSNVLT